jgi:hypothetical protein
MVRYDAHYPADMVDDRFLIQLGGAKDVGVFGCDKQFAAHELR